MAGLIVSPPNPNTKSVAQATDTRAGSGAQLLTGVVQSVSSAGVVVVTVRNANLPMSVLTSYIPTVGDTVSVLVQDAQYLCIGELVSSGEVWHDLAFANGWGNAGGTATVQYLRQGNDVWVVGTAQSPNPFNSTIGALPVGFRPLNQQGLWAWSNVNSGQLIRVDNGGNLVAFGDNRISTGWWINGKFSLVK